MKADILAASHGHCLIACTHAALHWFSYIYPLVPPVKLALFVFLSHVPRTLLRRDSPNSH